MTFSPRRPTALAAVLLLPLYLMASTALGDIVEMQLPGTYSLVPLAMEIGGETVCAPSLKVALLEVTGTAAKQLFVIPHSAFEVPAYSTERDPGFQACTALTMEANMVTRNNSASVLRRSRDLGGKIDMRVNLLKNLELLREAYFVGYEHGDRICNGYSKLSSGAISVWFAPGRRFSATYKDLLLNFQTDDKYIFYYSNPPCFYKADAKVVGNVKIIRSPSPLPGMGTIIPPNGRETKSGIQGNGNAAAVPAATAEPRGPACFPGNARVKVRVNGSRWQKGTQMNMDVGLLRDVTEMEVAISEVKIGDVIRDGPEGDKWTRVIAQTHSDDSAVTSMVQIDARRNATFSDCSFDRRLTLSGDHLVPRWGAKISLVPAGTLRVGDVLGSSLVISRIRRVRSKGLYAPVTSSGSMQVDGVLASCYAINWRLAHALLAPLRVSPPLFEWEGLVRRLRLLRATYDYR